MSLIQENREAGSFALVYHKRGLSGLTRGAGRKVLVHCRAGRSRSAAVVVAYLTTHEAMTLRVSLLSRCSEHVRVDSLALGGTCARERGASADTPEHWLSAAIGSL